MDQVLRAAADAAPPPLRHPRRSLRPRRLLTRPKRAKMTAFTVNGKPKRSIDSLRIERRYRNVLTLFLSGQMPDFTHQRHVHVANILKHLPYGEN